MKRLICFCLIAFCFQLYTIAQIELLYTSDEISFYNWSSNVSTYYSHDSIVVVATNKPFYQNSSYSNSIPLGYKAYDYDTFDIIAALNVTSNIATGKIEINSTGLSPNIQASFLIPKGYRFQAGSVSRHLYTSDNDNVFSISWFKDNYTSNDNERYLWQLIKEDGTVLLERRANSNIVTSHHGIKGEPSHRFEVQYHYYDGDNYKVKRELYSCGAPMSTIQYTDHDDTEPIHDTITQHDTIVVKEPYYTLNVNSFNLERGIGVGNGTFPKDCDVEIGAIPIQGYEFVMWHDGNRQNPRTVNIQSNATYYALFQPISTSMTSFNEQTPWDIQTLSNKIIITGAEGNHVKLFDTAGRCIYSGENHIIPVSVPGIYFLQIGNQPAIKVDIQF